MEINKRAKKRYSTHTISSLTLFLIPLFIELMVNNWHFCSINEE